MSFLTYDTADDIIFSLEIIEKLLFPETDFWHDNYLKADRTLSKLLFLFQQTISGAVQYNRIIDGKSTIGEICDKMTNKRLGAPIQRLAKVVNDKEDCLETDYAVLLRAIGNTSSSEDSGMSENFIY